jgi:hypothetical protein
MTGVFLPAILVKNPHRRPDYHDRKDPRPETTALGLKRREGERQATLLVVHKALSLLPRGERKRPLNTRFTPHKPCGTGRRRWPTEIQVKDFIGCAPKKQPHRSPLPAGRPEAHFPVSFRPSKRTVPSSGIPASYAVAVRQNNALPPDSLPRRFTIPQFPFSKHFPLTGAQQTCTPKCVRHAGRTIKKPLGDSPGRLFRHLPDRLNFVTVVDEA